MNMLEFCTHESEAAKMFSLLQLLFNKMSVYTRDNFPQSYCGNEMFVFNFIITTAPLYGFKEQTHFYIMQHCQLAHER